MVCAGLEIEKSILFFEGKGGNFVQEARKSNFTANCLNIFAAHSRSQCDIEYIRQSKSNENQCCMTILISIVLNNLDNNIHGTSARAAYEAMNGTVSTVCSN